MRDSMKKRQEQRDENKIEKMTMTTMKGSLGDAFQQAYMITFRGLEQRKNPNDIGK